MHTLPSLPCITAIALMLLTACADDDSGTTAADGSSTTTAPTTATTADTSTGPSDTTTAAASTGPDGTTTTADASTGPGDTEAPTGDSSGGAGLEITGTWFEEFAPGDGVTHVIDETTWQQLAAFGDALFHVEAFDNEARWVIAQGDATNEFFPELYSRFDWTWDGDALYYCTAVFDAATPADAEAGPASDPGALDTGCGGFPWSPLDPVR